MARAVHNEFAETRAFIHYKITYIQEKVSTCASQFLPEQDDPPLLEEEALTVSI